MFCCKRNPDKKIECMASLLILGGVVPLAFAITAQYGFNLPPCHFCILQRWPYVLVALCGVASLLVPRLSLRWRFAVALGIFGWLATAALGLIHTGIETKFLKYEGGCVASAEVSLEAILGSPLVSCDAVMAAFGGLSMASWNSLFALGMIVLTVLQYRFERRPRHGK